MGGEHIEIDTHGSCNCQADIQEQHGKENLYALSRLFLFLLGLGGYAC